MTKIIRYFKLGLIYQYPSNAKAHPWSLNQMLVRTTNEDFYFYPNHTSILAVFTYIEYIQNKQHNGRTLRNLVCRWVY